MKIRNLDTEDPAGFTKLVDLIIGRLAVAEIDAMTQLIRAQPGPPTENMKALLDTLARQRVILAGPPAPANAAPGLAIPAWAELIGRAPLVARGAGELPYSVREHLLARLASAERHDGPPVRVRQSGASAGTLTVINRDNYQSLIAAADQGRWNPPLIDEQTKGRLIAFASGGPRKLAFPPDTIAQTALSDVVEIVSNTFDKPPSLDHYKNAAVEAWQLLAASVEVEVFQAVGLPAKIRILGPKRDGSELGPQEKASYNHLTKTISVGAEHATGPRIAHEVGHHIEEQGPVEIWYALASYLQLLSAGRPLNRATTESSGNITYGVDNSNFPALPQALYSLSYYPDAGTELLAIALEIDLTEDLTDYWRKGEYRPLYDPVLALLVLYALRPREMREAGFSYSTLSG